MSNTEEKVEFPEGYISNIKNKTDGLSIAREKKDTMVAYYDEWAHTYDQDVVHPGFTPQVETMKEMRQMYPDNRGAVRILDAGAGTGLVGEVLYKEGFTDLDALDASQVMLDTSAKKNIYKNLICEYLDEHRLPIEDNAYDVCLVIGCLAPGHANASCFEELIRITKPGGKVLMMTREKFVLHEPQIQTLEPTIKRLAEAGKWKVQTRRIFDGFLGHDKGILIITEVL